MLAGEVEASSGPLKRKKEYVVTTASCLMRFRSRAHAADRFPELATTSIPRLSAVGHDSTHSLGSASDLQTMRTSSSFGCDSVVLMSQIVAVYTIDDGRPSSALEIVCYDDELRQSSTLVLTLNDDRARAQWLDCIRSTAKAARRCASAPIAKAMLDHTVHEVDSDRDYSAAHLSVHKVVRRPLFGTTTRSSSDELAKAPSTVCILAIGVNKVHLIPVQDKLHRISTFPSDEIYAKESYGILSLSVIELDPVDDAFRLAFRKPCEKPTWLHLASLSSADIAIRLRHADELIRPEWPSETRPFTLNAPARVEQEYLPVDHAISGEHANFPATLSAFCIAYGCNPANVRYAVDYDTEDAPRFELKEPSGIHGRHYHAFELLAVMRSLRYNESFRTISFAGIRLDELHGIHDSYGSECVCDRTKNGSPVAMKRSSLQSASLLVQEIRGLALGNRRLRRLDFTACVAGSDANRYRGRDYGRARGCGILEALGALCIAKLTNVDWVILNGIRLVEVDLDYLIQIIAEKACHLRAVELGDCGLNDRSISLILDALQVHENTLECIDLSNNGFRLNQESLHYQISGFDLIRKLNFSHVALSSSPQPLIAIDILLKWRLEEIVLTGMRLNQASIRALAR